MTYTFYSRHLIRLWIILLGSSERKSCLEAAELFESSSTTAVPMLCDICHYKSSTKSSYRRMEERELSEIKKGAQLIYSYLFESVLYTIEQDFEACSSSGNG